MKKIGLLLVSMMILSGCSDTNGIVSKTDIETLNYEDMESIVEEQKNISYIPDDVREFLEKLEESNKSNNEMQYGYLDIKSSIMENNNYGKIGFLHEIYTSDNLIDKEKIEFNKLVDILDQTISKGIKLYIDKHISEDVGNGIYTRIGRVWAFINPIDHQMELENKNSRNSVTLMIEVKDIKNSKYKEIVEDIRDEDLILNSIKIGKQRNLIELSNIEHRSRGTNKTIKPAISYQLFMNDNEIKKVRLSVESLAGERINENFKSLSNISEQFKFTMKDMKALEEIRTLLKQNKLGEESVACENFNLSYKNLENKNSHYAPHENTNLTEVIIERK